MNLNLNLDRSLNYDDNESDMEMLNLSQDVNHHESKNTKREEPLQMSDNDLEQCHNIQKIKK